MGVVFIVCLYIADFICMQFIVRGLTCLEAIHDHLVYSCKRGSSSYHVVQKYMKLSDSPYLSSSQSKDKSGIKHIFHPSRAHHEDTAACLPPQEVVFLQITTVNC